MTNSARILNDGGNMILSDGTDDSSWFASDGGIIMFQGLATVIHSIARGMSIDLIGAGSSLLNQSGADALPGLAGNEGHLSVEDGRNFITAGNFSVTGLVGVFNSSDENTTFTVSGNLAQLSGNSIQLSQYLAVPEPSRMLLAVLGCAAIAFRRQRRR